MDKKLLDSLNNLSVALESIADILNKKQTKSATGAALESGDFSKDIKQISVGIKSIKADTEKILKGQKTILELSKKKSSDKKTPMEEVGGDKKKESSLKKGVGTIILIAVAVLAIGMAFKLVGKIDFLSVIGLGIAIVIIAVAFEKIARLNMTLKQAAIASVAMVMMSIAVMMSSWALGMIRPIGLAQAVTGILIAGLFTVLSFGLPKIVKAIDNIKNPIKTGIYLILILPAIALGIALSSWVLSLIKPIGFAQALTGILIAAMFSVVAMGVGKIIKALDKIKNPVKTAFLLVLILPAIALAITASSYILSLVMPIGFSQAITAILIAALFVVLSFGIERIAKALGRMKWSDVAKMPVFFTLIAGAIAASAFIFAMAAPYFAEITFMMMLKVLILGVAMGIVLIIVAFAMKIMGSIKWGDVIKVPALFTLLSLAIAATAFIIFKASNYINGISFMTMFKLLVFSVCMAIAVVVTAIAMKVVNLLGSVMDYVKGGIAIVIIAATIMVASKILNKGDYKKYPDWKWSLGVGMSLVAFGLAAVVLGSIAMSGMGALAILAGCVMILAVAATVMASSHILNKGKYDKFPPILWALGAIAVMLPFGMAAVALGMIAITGLGAVALVAGLVMILGIAKTVVKTAEILGKGKYDKAPPILWTLQAGAAMLPFGMAAVALGMIAITGLGAVALVAGLVMILGIAKTVVKTAEILGKGKYDKAPPILWTLQAGAAMVPFGAAALALGMISITGIGAIAIVAGLVAILLVAKTIQETSKILDKGKYSGGPNLAWTLNTGLVMTGFGLAILTLGTFIVGTLGLGWIALEAGAAAVDLVAESIVSASKILQKGKYTGGPTKDWAEGIAIALGAFSPIYGMLMTSGIFSLFGGGGVSPTDFADAIVAVSEGIVTAAGFFAKNTAAFVAGPSKAWAEGVGIAIGAFAPVYKVLQDSAPGLFSSGGPTVEDMATAIMTISQGIVDAAVFFAGNTAPFEEGKYPSKKWGEGVGAALGAFAPVFKALNEESGFWTSGDEVIDGMVKAVSRISWSIVDSATAFSSLKDGWGIYPTTTWAEGVSSSVESYMSVIETVKELSLADTMKVSMVIGQIAGVARILFNSKKYFEFKLDSTWVKSLRSNVMPFATLAKELDKLLGYDEKISLKSGGVLGFGASTTTTTVRKMKDVSIVTRVISQMSDSARLLFNNKKFFGFILPQLWVSSLGNSVRRYALLTDFLMPGPYSWAGPKAGLNSPTIKVVNQMVLTAGILYKNRRLFSFNIDPNYMKSVASNVMDYALLAKNLALVDKDSSIIDDFFGNDPISKAAKGMIKIASAYDKLASAIKGFSGALNSLDGGKVNMFRSLTGNLALLSAMDSNMFSNMLKVLETRSGVFANLLRDQAKAEGIGKKGVKAPGGGGSTIQTNKTVGNDGQPKDSRGETQLQKLDKIIVLLSSMEAVVGSEKTLDSYLHNPPKESETIGKEK